jgi:hypothetical protein
MARHRLVLAAAGMVWILGIGAGARALWSHQTTPGAPGDERDRWPPTSRLVREMDRFTLVLAAHPQCPCTRASVDALARIVDQAGSRLRAHVLVMRPAEYPEGWEKTETWASAARIRGVAVISDLDGAEARRFGARTSGQALVFDPRGRLVFRGGLTAVRGHAGPSVAQDSIVALVEGRGQPAASAPVFGCALGG